MKSNWKVERQSPSLTSPSQIVPDRAPEIVQSCKSFDRARIVRMHIVRCQNNDRDILLLKTSCQTVPHQRPCHIVPAAHRAESQSEIPTSFHFT